MRVSTVQIYTQGVRGFTEQQTKLAHLQEQIASGRRLTRPSDDPAASSRILELEQTIEMAGQHQANINMAESRLQLQETVLVGVENAMLRMRELTLQANNSSLPTESRVAIAYEIDELREQLLSLANTVDADGAYLFAGFQNDDKPFVANSTGDVDHVNFIGDQGQRQLRISRDRQISVDTPGRELFMQVSSSAALNISTGATNTGEGVIAPANIVDPTTYVAGSYRIEFTAPGTYNVVDLSGPTTIVTGAAYTDGDIIEFNGIRTSIAGNPDATDSFSVNPGQYRDVFAMAGDLSAALRDASFNNDQRSAYLEQTLTDIDVAFGNLLQARTSIGGRLNSLDLQREDNGALIISSQESVGKLRDVDLAEAISQLSLEQTTLEAAQAVFARITSSSLFNFLR
jgi:flagellar hook-associated protein 3 FlgL